jgi:CHAT domain-containing protein
LWELPFQALESNSHRFVLNQFAVFYSPSLTALESMMRRQVPPNGRPTLLAYGNPAGLWSGSSLPLEQQTRGMVANLDDAEQEVAALKRLYGDAQSTVHVRSDASEKKAHAELGNYRILHFATHGILDAEDPMYSYLSLTPQGQSRANDGRLEANEILGMELRADLAVLSACQSAGGRVGSGEGLIGMSWAFFVAGCPTTVVSQWKVDSRSSRQLMVDFHRNLLRPPAEGESPHTAARALQQAALRLQKSSLFRHPFYWAPFIVMGKNAAF